MHSATKRAKGTTTCKVYMCVAVLPKCIAQCLDVVALQGHKCVCLFQVLLMVSRALSRPHRLNKPLRKNKQCKYIKYTHAQITCVSQFVRSNNNSRNLMLKNNKHIDCLIINICCVLHFIEIFISMYVYTHTHICDILN